MSVTFTKLFSSITESTIWAEPDHTRIVWITMLAMADRFGRVWASIPGLANRARVSVEACEEALQTLLSPDKYSRTKDHDGRRIEPIEGGWRLLNHDKYRAIRDEEAIKESKRKYINTRRAVEKAHLQSNGVDRSRANAEAYTDASISQPTAEVPQPSVKAQCPHLLILKIWAETLPSMPAHDPKLWRGSRAMHLKARWRETCVDKNWDTQEQGIEYFRKLFRYIGTSKFLTGRSPPTNGRPAFQADLAWVTNATNWAKIIEGKYHAEAV